MSEVHVCVVFIFGRRPNATYLPHFPDTATATD